MLNAGDVLGGELSPASLRLLQQLLVKQRLFDSAKCVRFGSNIGIICQIHLCSLLLWTQIRFLYMYNYILSPFDMQEKTRSVLQQKDAAEAAYFIRDFCFRRINGLVPFDLIGMSRTV